MGQYKPNPLRNNRGQSLVETVLILPLLIMLILNVVNLGYFFLIMVNLTGASRSSTEYSILGPATPTNFALPSVGPADASATNLTVTSVAQHDLTGALSNPSGASIQICSQVLGVQGFGPNQESKCNICTGTTCASGGNSEPNTDPEAPSFVLNEVDINYTFNTLFPGVIFNIPLQASAMCNSGTCTFTRRARMRAMN